LLLVHGWPETKRIWWRNIAPLAEAGFEVILGLDLKKVAFDGKVRDFARALEKADVLEIRTLDAQGEPVAGAEVRASATAPQPGGMPVFGQCRTGADGRCRMEDLEPGTFSVIAYSEKKVQAEATVEMKPGINTFGTGDKNDIVFPKGLGPERMGTNLKAELR